MGRPSFLRSFSRSQVSSAIATAVDFVLLFSMVEYLKVWYVIATAAGSMAGAITNFLLNRHWSFRALDMRWHRQAVRYAITSGLSLVLNAGLAYLFTDIVGIHYSISVVVASAAVGVLFNFPMHRHYVFR